jgi:ribosomal protein S18 acetylase RimI-like enzyme
VTEPRPIEPADADPAADVIGRAFRDDPGTVHIEPDPSLRDSRLTPFFRLNARIAAAFGNGFVVGAPIVAVVLLSRHPAPPGQEEPEVGAESLLRNIPAGTRERAGPMVDAINGFHADAITDAHWYIEFLATDPLHQGQGLATQLLDAVHDQADAEDLPTALLTFLDSNVRFYERRGYAVIGERDYLGELHLWAMRREPAIRREPGVRRRSP